MGDNGILFRFPAGVTYFLFSKIAGRGWSTPIFPVSAKQSLFTPGIKFTPSAPSLTAGVKNGLDFTSPTLCLHGMSRVNFPLYRQGRSTCMLTETQSPPPQPEFPVRLSCQPRYFSQDCNSPWLREITVFWY